MNRRRKRRQRYMKPPTVAYIAICAFPVIITVLFYILRSDPKTMSRAFSSISAPVRGFMSLLTSVYPFSLMEIILCAAGIWLICYIIRTIVLIIRRQGKLRILIRRSVTLAVTALYVWGLFCWLWNCGYYAPGFAETNGFSGGGVTVEDLTTTTRLFAEKANELATLVKRDEEGHYAEDQRAFFKTSTLVYSNLALEFPGLDKRTYKPKPMMFSWLMSRTGYTGVYFAFTGEANVNTKTPAFFLPATMAHELAHQLGVAAEDEANFVGILASVTSEYTEFEYSGYLLGLSYLLNALFIADYDVWVDVNGSLCDEVKRDFKDNRDFWESQKTFNTGSEFFNNLFTNVTKTVSETVDNVYDGYLKAQNQVLGIRSYGACVNLLVEYFN